jgi:hypothetical protein
VRAAKPKRASMGWYRWFLMTSFKSVDLVL